MVSMGTSISEYAEEYSSGQDNIQNNFICLKGLSHLRKKIGEYTRVCQYLQNVLLEAEGNFNFQKYQKHISQA